MAIATDDYIRAYEHAVANMVLTCVQEAPFSLGVKKIISVLRGSKSMLVTEYRLHELTTYGVLAACSASFLQGAIDMLLTHELLVIETLAKHENLSVLKLTKQGQAVLRGEVTIALPFIEQLCDRTVIELTKDEQALFDDLRLVRKQLATSKQLPPYTICHDTALREMVRQKPTTPAALLTVRGIGDRFVDNYGQRFLGILRTAAQ